MKDWQRSGKGFLSLNPHERSRIARMGGKAAHRQTPGKKLGHEWTPEEAAAAGKKGGTATQRRRQARLAAKGRQ